MHIVLRITILIFTVCTITFTVAIDNLDEYVACKLFGVSEEDPVCDTIIDQELDMPALMARYGYTVETHVIVSRDGYIQKLHRMRPKKKRAQPILLLHGLGSAGGDFISNGNQSLGFLLANKGLDVWIPNKRGSLDSRGHVRFHLHSPEYWNFSFHEIGVYDLPAIVKHIVDASNRPGELLVLGHSMGAASYMVFASTYPKLNANVKLMVGLAPAVTLKDVTSPLKYLLPFADNIEWIRTNLGVQEVVPSNTLLGIVHHNCQPFTINKKVCTSLMSILSGIDAGEVNVDRMNVILSKGPSDESVKTLVHYGQIVRSGGKFLNFDYGIEKNLKRYGTPEPPLYNISQIQTPVFFMYGMTDSLSSPINVKMLASLLPNVIAVEPVKKRIFEHTAFTWGKNVEKHVFEPVWNVMKEYVAD